METETETGMVRARCDGDDGGGREFPQSVTTMVREAARVSDLGIFDFGKIWWIICEIDQWVLFV